MVIRGIVGNVGNVGNVGFMGIVVIGGIMGVGAIGALWWHLVASLATGDRFSPAALGHLMMRARTRGVLVSDWLTWLGLCCCGLRR